MKRFFNIFGLTLAVCALVVFAILPHHHHNDDTPCFSIQACDNHGECDSEHNHNDCGDCPTVSSYIISEHSHSDHRCKVEGCGDNHFDINFSAPIFIVGVFFELVPPDDGGLDINYNTFALSVARAAALGAVGLRAPPVA